MRQTNVALTFVFIAVMLFFFLCMKNSFYEMENDGNAKRNTEILLEKFDKKPLSFSMPLQQARFLAIINDYIKNFDQYNFDTKIKDQLILYKTASIKSNKCYMKIRNSLWNLLKNDSVLRVHFRKKGSSSTNAITFDIDTLASPQLFADFKQNLRGGDAQCIYFFDNSITIDINRNQEYINYMINELDRLHNNIQRDPELKDAIALIADTSQQKDILIAELSKKLQELSTQ
jgi:hypothetical protein